MASVSTCGRIFGRAAPGQDTPALYLVGTVQGRYGLFRSTDAAASWQRINDNAHQWGLILHISGDPKVFGRVYVGTTSFGGKVAFRPVIVNWRTRASDIDLFVEVVRELGASLLASTK